MKSEQRTVTADVKEMRAEGKTLRGFAALYGTESRDLGGYTEMIQRGAFTGALTSDLDCYLTLNHDESRVLARTTSGTLRLADQPHGLAFEADLGDGPTAQDVRDMVRRGDVSGASFRFVVAPDGEQWDGERRTLTRIEKLIDLSLATTPAYDGPRVELRTKPDSEEHNVPDSSTNETSTAATTSTGGNTSSTLQVEDRTAARPAGLANAFRRAGFPGETATITWGEFRTATFSEPVDVLNPTRTTGVPLGADVRYAFPAFPQQAVEAGLTSVQVLRQSSRGLPAAADVVRPIDSTTPKPEVDTDTGIITCPLNQVAVIQSGIPNLILEQPQIESLINVDLRLALNEGLDALVLDAVADSDNQDPGGDPLLVSIRKSITTIQASGYAPDTLILTPQDAEDLDVLQTSGPEEFYVFGAGRFAPGQLFGLNVRVSKTVDVPVVVDAAAFGKLYVSPITLARFEENAGSTNTSTVRLEGHAAFGTERQDAAVRIDAT
jgi:HK97 family phage prohead protease